MEGYQLLLTLLRCIPPPPLSYLDAINHVRNNPIPTPRNPSSSSPNLQRLFKASPCARGWRGRCQPWGSNPFNFSPLCTTLCTLCIPLLCTTLCISLLWNDPLCNAMQLVPCRASVHKDDISDASWHQDDAKQTTGQHIFSQKAIKHLEFI